MTFLLFSAAVAAAFFVGSIFLLNLGRRLGARYLNKEGADGMAGLKAIEGAVFALMGLLLAFAISGALQRFDDRKQLILQEANAISSAYDRLDLLEKEARDKLKLTLKNYLQARIQLYRLPLEFSLRDGLAIYSREQQEKIFGLRTEIWNEAVAACPQSKNATACTLLLPALNSAFEIARMRSGANERHPPQIIFIMLFGLGLGASLLGGFGMASTKKQSRVHVIIFALALAFTLFIITDIEFPRLSLIHLDYFDHVLVDVYAQMR